MSNLSRCVRAASALAALLLAPMLAPPAAALQITPVFVPGGNFVISPLTGTPVALEGASTTAAGGGTLQSVVEAAADYWEGVFSDNHQLTLFYGWADLGGSLAESHPTFGPLPGTGLVRFSNSSAFSWFLDPTPLDNAEYAGFTGVSADLGGGALNAGRVHSGGSGDSAGFDLFTVALHEIAHDLGFAFLDFLGAQNGALAITDPRPRAGTAIPLTADGSHVDIATALLNPFGVPGGRLLPSDVDIIGVAEANQWTGFALAPLAVPAPASAWTLAAGLLFLLLVIASPRRAGAF